MVKSHNSISIFIISNDNIFGFKEKNLNKNKIKTTKALKMKEKKYREKDIQSGSFIMLQKAE